MKLFMRMFCLVMVAIATLEISADLIRGPDPDQKPQRLALCNGKQYDVYTHECCEGEIFGIGYCEKARGIHADFVPPNRYQICSVALSDDLFDEKLYDTYSQECCVHTIVPKGACGKCKVKIPAGTGMDITGSVREMGYDTNKYVCCNDKIVNKGECNTRMCGSQKMMDTQECCKDSSGKYVVTNNEYGLQCCGGKLMHNTHAFCCNGVEVSDKQLCCNGIPVRDSRLCCGGEVVDLPPVDNPKVTAAREGKRMCCYNHNNKYDVGGVEPARDGVPFYPNTQECCGGEVVERGWCKQCGYFHYNPLKRECCSFPELYPIYGEGGAYLHAVPIGTCGKKNKCVDENGNPRTVEGCCNGQALSDGEACCNGKVYTSTDGSCCKDGTIGQCCGSTALTAGKECCDAATGKTAPTGQCSATTEIDPNDPSVNNPGDPNDPSVNNPGDDPEGPSIDDPADEPPQSDCPDGQQMAHGSSCNGDVKWPGETEGLKCCAEGWVSEETECEAATPSESEEEKCVEKRALCGCEGEDCSCCGSVAMTENEACCCPGTGETVQKPDCRQCETCAQIDYWDCGPGGECCSYRGGVK